MLFRSVSQSRYKSLTDTLAVGSGNIVSVVLLVCGLVQLGVPELATLTMLIVVLVVYVPLMVAVPEAFKVTVWFAPPLMLYVTVAFGVPVKVNVALLLAQIVVGLTATLAVGSDNTLSVALLVCGLIQLGVPALATLTMLMVVLLAYVPLMVAVPEAFSVTV